MNNQSESDVLSNSQRKKLAAALHNRLVSEQSQVQEVLTLEQHDELSALSKEVFNSTSRYNTLLRKGLVELSTEETTEYVPAVLDADGKEVTPEEMRKVRVPVKYVSPKRGQTSLNSLKNRTFTYETVKAFMLERKAQQDKIKELIAKAKADHAEAEAKKKLLTDVQKVAGGSTL